MRLRGARCAYLAGVVLAWGCGATAAPVNTSPYRPQPPAPQDAFLDTLVPPVRMLSGPLNGQARASLSVGVRLAGATELDPLAPSGSDAIPVPVNTDRRLAPVKTSLLPLTGTPIAEPAAVTPAPATPRAAVASAVQPSAAYGVTNSVVPEPGALSLIAVAGATLLTRRRRK